MGFHLACHMSWNALDMFQAGSSLSIHPLLAHFPGRHFFYYLLKITLTPQWKDLFYQSQWMYICFAQVRTLINMGHFWNNEREGKDCSCIKSLKQLCSLHWFVKSYCKEGISPLEDTARPRRNALGRNISSYLTIVLSFSHYALRIIYSRWKYQMCNLEKCLPLGAFFFFNFLDGVSC